jgi:hypothetical protein
LRSIARDDRCEFSEASPLDEIAERHYQLNANGDEHQVSGLLQELKSVRVDRVQGAVESDESLEIRGAENHLRSHNPEQLAEELALQVKIVAKRGRKEHQNSHQDGKDAEKCTRGEIEAHGGSSPEFLSYEHQKCEHTQTEARYEHTYGRVELEAI